MIFLLELDAHNGTSLQKLYVGTHGIRSGPTDSPANQYYEPRLGSVGRFERSMFGNGDGLSGGTTTGRSEVGFGNVSILNGTPYGESDLIDHWKNLAFRSLTIKSLTDQTQSFGHVVTRFVGTIEQLVSTNALVQFDLVIHDRLQDLDRPLLTHAYLGTTTSGALGTVEGDVDLKDQIKPKIWGTVHNVAAVSVNPFDLIWQVSDGPVASIATYDGGVALTPDGDRGSLPALFAGTVPAGRYSTCLSLGLVRLGSPPVGAVTCDVVEGATAAARTAGQIASRMIAWFQAMNPNLTASVLASDVAALDALNSAQCGILVQDTETALTAMSRLLTSVGAWMLPQSNSTSLFNLGRLDLAIGSAVASYDFDDNIGGNPERIETGDESRGIPAWRVIVKYDQVATVQTADDLFGVVTENDPVRVQYLSTEWRQASAENSAILTVWPNAPTITVETRLVLQADAQREAARLFSLYGAQRDMWRVTVPMSANPDDDPGVGEVVELTSRSGRMGLGREVGSGELYRVMGRADDFDAVPRLELTLWGSPTVALHVVVPDAINLGTLAATEQPSTASFSGTLTGGLNKTGTLAATDGPSTANFAGAVSGGFITGTMAATGAANTASFAGSVTSPGLDSSVSAWITAINNVGGSVSTTRQGHVNTLVSGLKTNNLWNKIEYLLISSGEDEPSALRDLKTLRVASTIGSPLFTPNEGYTCVAGVSYLNTNFDIQNHAVSGLTYGSMHLASWNLTDGMDTLPMLCAFDFGEYQHYPKYTDGSMYLRTNTNLGGGFPVGDCRGFILGNRDGDFTIQGYLNGVSIGNHGTVNAAAVIHSTSIIIYNRKCAAVSIGPSLNATEQLTYYNLMRTFMTAIGIP